MNLTTILHEARAYSDKNPKNSINSILRDRLFATTDNSLGVLNLFVSFTLEPKLGINPKSRYNTPIGVYSYPAEYVEGRAQHNKQMGVSVPFAGSAPYVNIFEARGNIINLQTITQAELSTYQSKLLNILTTFYHDDELANKVMGKILEQSTDPDVNAHADDEAGGILWFLTMKIAGLIAKTNSNTAVVWNKVFRTIGIDGVVDPGLSIIHKNEPTQAVFFSIKAIVNNDRVPNKYSPDHMSANTDIWQQTNAGKKQALVTNSMVVKFAESLTIDVFNKFFLRYVASSLTRLSERGTYRPSIENYPWQLILKTLNSPFQLDPALVDHIVQVMPGVVKYYTDVTQKQLEYAASLHIGYLRDIPASKISEQMILIGAHNTPPTEYNYLGLVLKQVGFPSRTTDEFNHTIVKIFPRAFFYSHIKFTFELFKESVIEAKRQGFSMFSFLDRLETMQQMGQKYEVQFNLADAIDYVNRLMQE